ncbi:glutamate-1-semialdehyde 2,1-aminomutase [Rhodocytophaga aerolata]|uniref:Glutamate-1-semialdehyde 2,1-aminomutase n=1 Tax=Rhodocytophaga aerolata TaxID=455078 RepID=A0ABT8RF62_9BACT|nr:glutamate-1-semialdehyde 2,1-aminomutase [Rhodocytophaga aerolata]MDO1449410.1 glutamate-1-semialdehyde 2,1-aminomutase [Rhodocytophaga aerolata]
MNLQQSLALQRRFHAAIPGGSHTYAKGDDQFPEHILPIIAKGKGCLVWDVDGNEYMEYGMGLRSVTLGHAYEPVIEAACRQMQSGINFNRPAAVELACAEQFLDILKGADMVKFAKNGSDATSGAIKLARAYTGRDRVAICAEHPFFSVDDWFIGSTAINAGIPQAVKELTLKFSYNSLESARTLFETYPGEIACLILEAEKETPPAEGFLQGLKKLCHQQGALFILDEIITGFRWHLGGAQTYYGVVPDLSTFGKALGNGFSISALAGKKEIMELGGLQHTKERVFLLSTTYGAETHSLAAAMATMQVYKQQPVIEFLYQQGLRLAKGIGKSIQEHGLEEYFTLMGKPCCLVYGTKDWEKKPSQLFRTLFLQETLTRGLLMPSLIVSYSHQDTHIDRTIEAIHEALAVYRKALDEGIDKYLHSRPVKPVYRTKN